MFNLEKFKEALSGTPLKIREVIRQHQVIYVEFENSNISCIRINSGNFVTKNNCINIYHGDSTKNGYWWDGELKYKDLVNEIMKYETKTAGAV